MEPAEHQPRVPPCGSRDDQSRILTWRLRARSKGDCAVTPRPCFLLWQGKPMPIDPLLHALSRVHIMDSGGGGSGCRGRIGIPISHVLGVILRDRARTEGDTAESVSEHCFVGTRHRPVPDHSSNNIEHDIRHLLYTCVTTLMTIIIRNSYKTPLPPLCRRLYL